MSDLKKYIEARKKRDRAFSQDFDAGYQDFKFGVILRQEREKAGMTQDEVARKLHTKKSAISRIENHAEDIRLSTLEKFVSVMGRKLEIKIA
jgi:ribosome-binding protein aMBF1 (putative translation factor)